MTSKVERQITLLNVLLRTPRALHVDEIHARVPGYSENPDSFRRAFERDKVDLRDMGVQLEVETVPGSDPPIAGYRIDARTHALRDPGLEPDEIEALALASALIGGRGLTAAFLKLGVGVPDRRPGVEVPTDPELSEMLGAIGDRRTVRFRYRDVDRTVEPHRLELLRGRWYLTGFDRTRDEIRSFRRDRIDGPVTVGDRPHAFADAPDQPPEVTIEPWAFDEPSEPIAVTVRFDLEIADAVRAELRTGDITAQGPDGLEVTLTVSNRAGFRSWVLQFLDRAEVIAPEEMRREIAEVLETMVHG